MLGLEVFKPVLSEIPGCEEGNEFSNILESSRAKVWKSARGKAKAKAKNVKFCLGTTETCHLAKIAWLDSSDGCGVAEMRLDAMVGTSWQQVAQWKASRSGFEQCHEFPVSNIRYTNKWRMHFVSTHDSNQQIIINYVKFFKVVFPVEEDDCVCLHDVDEEEDNQGILLSKMNQKMWEDRKFTDVTVICNGERIEAHRCVLAAASPVFSTMLETGMTEAHSREIVIDDIETTAAVKAMVQFMYTADETSAEDDGIYYATLVLLGHKYAIFGLITTAARRLMERLSGDDICAVVRLLRPYAEDPLLKSVFLLVQEAIHKDSVLLYSLMAAV